MTAFDGHAMVSITCGPDHTTAYSDSQMQVYSWRWGDFGRLGHGNSSDLFTPQPIKALQGIKIKQIACGDSHCLAVTMKGEVQRCQVVGDTLWRTHLMEVLMARDGISLITSHSQDSVTSCVGSQIFGVFGHRYQKKRLDECSKRNYVDHHVSAREQIALQDTMEGMVYHASQFGLDERFGDGDASQIGLDLDEEDVNLMSDMGREAHRFSISWPQMGIEPHVILLYLNFPQVLEDGHRGWLNPKFL